MILRRLAQSLKEQNWTAIWIEFVLLVLGVFLGIQVSNWNDARHDLALEAEYLARLQRDFHAIDARLTANLSSWERNAEAPIHLLADLEAFHSTGTWPRTRADMLADFGNTMGSRIPPPRAASYVELLSAGKLGLIRDTRLRDALLEYDTQTGVTMNAYDSLVERVDPQRPAIIAHLQFDPANAVARADPVEAFRKGLTVWRDVDLVKLANDHNVKVALNMFASASNNQLLNARLQQEKAQAVMALLERRADHRAGRTP